MKKNFILLSAILAGLSFTNCEYIDDKLWDEMEQVKDRLTSLENAVNQANTNISSLQTIVKALQQNLYITAVTSTADGYTMTFSDGKTATISNGKDGANAPEISVKQDTDDNYYWTLDGEWLMVDGHKVVANGLAGENGTDGKDAIAPQVRINENSKEWEISTDGGKTWTSTGVVAEGKNTSGTTSTESIFKSVDTTNDNFVIVTLADGTSIKLERYDESAPLFIIKEVPEIVSVKQGASVEFVVETKNIADYTINKPDGWKVALADNKLTITAPNQDACHCDFEGVIAITSVSSQGKSSIVKIKVKINTSTYELRILTFEDSDAKFTSYSLDYAGASINTWSDLIDEVQYGGNLLYNDYFSAEYTWWDEGNTELMHHFPYNYNAYCYWGGGHAISNYSSLDIETYGNHESQLTVYAEEGKAGNNGSSNFCMHYGYIDGSPWNGTEFLPELMFADGKARIIDHMYVNNSTYALNCYVNGNSLTPNIGSEDWVKIVATGYNEQDEEIGTTDIYLCNGPDNIVQSWTKWDLSSLGKVYRVTFNIIGSSDNGYGYSQPAYFAYDDIAVRFE